MDRSSMAQPGTMPPAKFPDDDQKTFFENHPNQILIIFFFRPGATSLPQQFQNRIVVALIKL
jgi:hypothetical protein